MGNYCPIFRRKLRRMSSGIQTVICVKQVKQDELEDWDESMPLPGDIIVGFAEKEADEVFVTAKTKLELSNLLGKASSKLQSDVIWLKVRRGEDTPTLRARVVPGPKYGKLSRKFTVGALSNDRHVAVLGDLPADRCLDLQEMSRRIVNVESRGFKTKGVKYEWKMKMCDYLPDSRCPVVMSILFMPLVGEHSVELTTARSMAWFTAAVSSGVPLLFFNIQTEQILSSDGLNTSGKELTSSRDKMTTVEIVQGIRLWFLPGIAEIPIEFLPDPGESKLGMEIKKTDEGFFYVISVTRQSAADRAGLGGLYQEAMENGYLLVISRLEKKSLLPSRGTSDGMLKSCDHIQIKETLALDMERSESVTVHVMAWQHNSKQPASQANAAIRPPSYPFWKNLHYPIHVFPLFS